MHKKAVITKVELQKMMFFLASLILIGCSTSAGFIPADVTHHLNSPEEIKILTEPPQFPYHVLGTIHARGTSEKDITDALKRKAFEVGADALIDVVQQETAANKSEKSKGAYASSGLMWNVPKRKMDLLGPRQAQATAIQYIIKEKKD
ncbi:MAG: hypothetical protein KJ893_02375 [Candidatus Omnitrophica bacterium]|nr:hypothetical protein [Candidatus Omnitrophota bacterium]MBU4478186.1 hypothetical protein [Candidatus Omnitrophota bacterium]MCG2703818.1 hypothetical protein [Candidatus Omnitrophota bacterium]